MATGRRPVLRVLAIAGAVVVTLGAAFTIVDMAAVSKGATVTPEAPGSPEQIHLTQRGFSFVPPTLVVHAGRGFTFRVTHDSWTDHTFTVPLLGIDAVLAPGQERTLSFTIAARRVIPFMCRFHQAQGMQGLIRAG
jgi:plastocyanin